jgi:hypothetical protein
MKKDLAMFSTTDELIEESKRLAEAQPSDFQETLSYVITNSVDPSILELINIVSNYNEQAFVTTTRI